MANKANQAAFDPKVFLAKVGEGKTILEYRKDQIVFAQGDPAETVFYIQKGRVKVVVISEQGTQSGARRIRCRDTVFPAVKLSGVSRIDQRLCHRGGQSGGAT
jgi:hypothetical protein